MGSASMGKKKAKPNYRRIVLRLPDLDHSKLVVLNSLSSPRSRPVYQYWQRDPATQDASGSEPECSVWGHSRK